MSKAAAETPAATVDLAALGAAIAAGITAAQPKVIKEGDPEYTERLKAEGFFDEFERPVIQNGYSAQPRGLSEQTRHRASNLKSGKYLSGRVFVENNGRAVFINYPTSKIDDRFKNQTLWHDFSDLVDKMWAEMHPSAAA